jgi:hypothetical protein
VFKTALVGEVGWVLMNGVEDCRRISLFLARNEFVFIVKSVFELEKMFFLSTIQGKQVFWSVLVDS